MSIETIRTWYDQSAKDLDEYGVASTLRVSPETNSLRSVTIDAESPHGVGQLTVWESGAAEQLIGMIDADDPPVPRDLSVQSREDFTRAITEMARAISAAP